MKISDCNQPACLMSVVMPNYNCGNYINRAIQSVVNQSFKEWELIIVDDGSTDCSLEIIDKWIKEYPDKIKLVKHSKNYGAGKAWISGIKLVGSNIVGMLDSDDALAKNALEVMYQAHQDRPDCSLIYSQFIFCNEPMFILKGGFCKLIPQGQSNLETDAVSHFKTFKMNYYKKCAKFDQKIKVAIDKDIAYKLEEVGNTHFINEFLYFYRMRKISLSANISYARKGHELVKNNAIKRRKRKRAVVANQVPKIEVEQKTYNNVLNTLFDKIYCINLSRCSDRWLKMCNRFERNQIEVERIEAVDGQNLEFNISNLNVRGNKLNIVGCFLSHKKVYDMICHNNIQKALILEDDVDFSKKLNNFDFGVLPEWDILYLGASQFNWNVKFGINYYVNNLETSGTFAYAVTLKAADILRRHIFTVKHTLPPIDVAIPAVVKQYSLKSITIYPNLIIPDITTSDLRGKKRSVGDFLKKMRWPVSHFTIY